MKEKYSLKDFQTIDGMNFIERAKHFQLYIDQLNKDYHQPYYTRSMTGIDSKMIAIDNYTQKEQEIVAFVSNDYLGMSKNPETISAGIEAIKKYGTGACAAPIIGGFLDIHRQLEIKLANFLCCEDAYIFSSGFGANAGVLSALMGKNDIALTDSFIHASVYDGLHETNVKSIGHNDLKYLEMTLKAVKDKYDTKLVIIDGVYSQNGDLGLLPEYIEICHKYGAQLMVDDAHGIGVFGENGRGTTEYYNVLGQVDILTGTLSKAFGCIGGFVAASKKIIQYLKYYSRTSTFSAAPTPQVTASVIKALDIIVEKPEIRQRLWQNTEYMKRRLLENGYDIKETVSPIFPIMIRDNYLVKEVALMLMQKGYYAVGICYPAVSNNEARIRASVLATHTEKDIDGFVNAMNEINEQLHFTEFSSRKK